MIVALCAPTIRFIWCTLLNTRSIRIFPVKILKNPETKAHHANITDHPRWIYARETRLAEENATPLSNCDRQQPRIDLTDEQTLVISVTGCLVRSTVAWQSVSRSLGCSINEYKLRRDAQRSGDPLSTFAPYDSLSRCSQGKRERERNSERSRALYLTADLFSDLFSVLSRLQETLSAKLPSFLPSFGSLVRNSYNSRVHDVDRDIKIASKKNLRIISMNFDAFFSLQFYFLLDPKPKRNTHNNERHDARRGEPHQLRSAADHSGLTFAYRQLRTFVARG